MSEFWFPSPKGILHQPQGDDGSPGWLLRVQLSSQRQGDRPPFGLKRMVSSSAGPSPTLSNGTTLTSRSTAPTAFPSVSRRSPFSSSDGVTPLKRLASQADFSETVAGHLALCRRNSRLNGQAREGMFRNWYRIFHY